MCFAANEIKGICVEVVDEIKITFIFLSLNAIFGFLIYVDLSFFAALIESFLLISNTYLQDLILKNSKNPVFDARVNAMLSYRNAK